MKILKNIILLVIALVGAYFTAEWFGVLYTKLIGVTQAHGLGAFWGSEDLLNLSSGIIPAFVAYLTVLFTAFGGKKKYWWVGILLLPVLWFVWKFDLAHWYFYVGLALAGWIVGWIIGKLISSFRRK